MRGATAGVAAFHHKDTKVIKVKAITEAEKILYETARYDRYALPLRGSKANAHILQWYGLNGARSDRGAVFTANQRYLKLLFNVAESIGPELVIIMGAFNNTRVDSRMLSITITSNRWFDIGEHFSNCHARIFHQKLTNLQALKAAA